MIPESYVPISREVFVEFSLRVLDDTLRGAPTKDRRALRKLVYLVSQKTYDDYVEIIAIRMAKVNAKNNPYFPPSIPPTPTYCGIPVEVDEEIPDDMVELYGPPDPVMGDVMRVRA